jgi:hypothetical protein
MERPDQALPKYKIPAICLFARIQILFPFHHSNHSSKPFQLTASHSESTKPLPRGSSSPCLQILLGSLFLTRNCDDRQAYILYSSAHSTAPNTITNPVYRLFCTKSYRLLAYPACLQP